MSDFEFPHDNVESIFGALTRMMSAWHTGGISTEGLVMAPPTCIAVGFPQQVLDLVRKIGGGMLSVDADGRAMSMLISTGDLLSAEDLPAMYLRAWARAFAIQARFVGFATTVGVKEATPAFRSLHKEASYSDVRDNYSKDPELFVGTSTLYDIFMVRDIQLGEWHYQCAALLNEGDKGISIGESFSPEGPFLKAISSQPDSFPMFEDAARAVFALSEAAPEAISRFLSGKKLEL